MQLINRDTIISPLVVDFLSRFRELNLVRYASEAAYEMEFSGQAEQDDVVKRAVEVCRSFGLEIENNFKRVYRCTDRGVVPDWKLSALAYELVCINGWPSNAPVARRQVELIRAIC